MNPFQLIAEGKASLRIDTSIDTPKHVKQILFPILKRIPKSEDVAIFSITGLYDYAKGDFKYRGATSKTRPYYSVTDLMSKLMIDDGVIESDSEMPPTSISERNFKTPDPCLLVVRQYLDIEAEDVSPRSILNLHHRSYDINASQYVSIIWFESPSQVELLSSDKSHPEDKMIEFMNENVPDPSSILFAGVATKKHRIISETKYSLK